MKTYVDTLRSGMVRLWADYVPVEQDVIEQLKNVASLPFIHKHVAGMPDAHVGIGATVGSVIATSGAIIPAAVGVDIGCGMMAVRLNLTANDLPDNLHEIRCAIEAAVPHGRTDNGGKGDEGAHKNVEGNIGRVWEEVFKDRYAALCDKHPRAKALNSVNHLGTLGGGNHFIEICLDEVNDAWVMLHSGSRGLGNKIGQYFIEKAKEEMERYFISLPDKDLSYLVDGSSLFDDYVVAIELAQEFAAANRGLILSAVMGALREFFPSLDVTKEAINCHHNYVAMEHHFGKNVLVTRKGAVRARETDLGIIPGSMGAKSFIVRGKGNKDSFCSCSHGAGRVMSRTEAKKLVTLAEHIRDTSGVECKKDNSVLDESPKAYKNIDDVMKSQDDLVEIIHTLKQVLCVKG